MTSGLPFLDGKETWGINGNFRERFQVDSGVLSNDTDQVALTIGGNDVGFPQVMQGCAISGCPAEDDVHSDIDDAVFGTSERPGVKGVLNEIHGKAPNTKIVLLGYPGVSNRRRRNSPSKSPSLGSAA